MNLDIHRDKPCNKWKLTKPESVLNPNQCLALTPYSARELIFSGVIARVYRPALLILTLFQKNIYKVNVREYPWGFMSRKWTLSIINLNKTSMLNEGNHCMKMCLKLAYSAFSSSPSKDPTISTFWFLFFFSLFVEVSTFWWVFLFQNVIATQLYRCQLPCEGYIRYIVGAYPCQFVDSHDHFRSIKSWSWQL